MLSIVPRKQSDCLKDALLRLVLQLFLLFAVVLQLSLAVFCQSSSVPTRIHGVVHDGKGRPVRNADVSVESSGKIDHFTTSGAGDFAGSVTADGGPIRVTASAKGHQAAHAQTTAAKDSPLCVASLILTKERHEGNGPSSLECEEPAPFASLPNFEAAMGDQEFAVPGRQVFSSSTHIAPGVAKVSSTVDSRRVRLSD